MLQNAYLDTKIGVDLAEKEPRKAWLRAERIRALERMESAERAKPPDRGVIYVGRGIVRRDPEKDLPDERQVRRKICQNLVKF